MSIRFFHSLKQTCICWYEDKASQIAAASAFYLLFSLIPLLIITTYLLGTLLDKKLVEQEIQTHLTNFFGSDIAFQIKTMISNFLTATSQNSILMAFGVTFLIISALGFFIQIQSGLNQIWGVKQKPGLGIVKILRDRLVSFILVITVAFLLLLSVLLNSVLRLIGTYTQINFIVIQLDFFNFTFSFLILSALFASLFKILPDVSNRWKDVWLGAMLTSFLFTIGKYAIEFYISKSNFLSYYGASATIIILMVWIYYSTQILFFGAEFTKIHSHRNRTTLKPLKDATKIHT